MIRLQYFQPCNIYIQVHFLLDLRVSGTKCLDLCGMEVNGTQFTEKAEAGEAILAVCKANQSLEPVPLGSYRGFKMELSYDSF